MANLTEQPRNESPTSSDVNRTIDELRDQVESLRARVEKLETEQEGLWTIQEVGEYLSVSVRTVERIIKKGRLQPIWIRHQRRFEPEAVRRYVREYGPGKN